MKIQLHRATFNSAENKEQCFILMLFVLETPRMMFVAPLREKKWEKVKQLFRFY